MDVPTRHVSGLVCKRMYAWRCRIAVVEMDLEETADVEKEQRQHRDPGADRWGRQADVSVRSLG